ncbi:MAG: hypothetical protein GX222_01315 [Ruminococcaceae bacterium]|nr:hypothetical protein [Oscillospiraceae bacterium]
MGNKLIKQKSSKLPSKRTMNLYQIEITDNSWQRVIPYAILITVIVIAFTRFGVFRRISQLNKLGEEVSKAQAQLNEFNMSLEDYDDVNAEFIRYTDNYMLEEEGKLVDRIKIIGLIDKNVSNIGEVKSYSIAGNTVSLEVIVDKLDAVRIIRKQLETVDWVGNITVNTATKSDSSTGLGEVSASIVFDVVYQGDFDASGTAKTIGGEEGNG